MGNSEEVEVEPSDADEKAMQEFMQMPSTMPDIGVDLRCFASEDEAKLVGEAVNSYLHMIGKILNLKRLLRVIVAFDYHETLAGLDRGTTEPRPLMATNDEIAVGIAMTPVVLHEGEPRSVMVLNAASMIVFARADNPELEFIRDEMVYTLAHECGHVHDLDMQVKCLPETMLKTQLSFRDGILFSIASGCWEEYIASRLSAFMGKEFTLHAYEDTFCSALERAKGRADAAIRQYRMHHDVARVTEEVSGEYRKVMIYTSYLLGHVDGLNRALEECAPKARGAIENNGYFGPFFSKLRDELRAMHGTYDEWSSLAVYEPLKELAHELLMVGGINIQVRPDGAAYVDIPLLPETTPTVEEQTTFLSLANKPSERE